MPNKGFALQATLQFETRLQEFRLWSSKLDGSWQAMPSITTFLTTHAPSLVHSEGVCLLLTHQGNSKTDLMLINLWNSTANKFRIDCFISDLSMRRTSTASGSLENLKGGHHEELYPHYHLVMSRHSIYIRAISKAWIWEFGDTTRKL